MFNGTNPQGNPLKLIICRKNSIAALGILDEELINTPIFFYSALYYFSVLVNRLHHALLKPGIS